MTARGTLPVAFVAVGVIVAGGVYAKQWAAPGCDSEAALRQVSDILRQQFQYDSTFVNNVRTVSGGYFSERRECSAEVTQVRGNISASDMPWRDLRYSIAQRDASTPPEMTLQIGGDIPLAPARQSLWIRLFGQQ